MLRDETVEFVETQLKHCQECGAELQMIKDRDQLVETETMHRIEESNAIKNISKKVRREKWRIGFVIAIVILTIVTLLYFFPIYRYFKLAPMDYYSNAQITNAMYIGSKEDRAEA